MIKKLNFFYNKLFDDIFVTPKRSTPFIFLYDERITNWTLADFMKWRLHMSKPGNSQGTPKKQHPFFMPILTSYGVLFCYISYKVLFATVEYFHTGIANTFAFKTCMYWIIFLALRWTLKVRKGSYSPYLLTNVVQKNLMLGLLLFIISEIMIFFALFWTYFHVSVNPSVALGGIWPPYKLEVLEWWRWPTLSTVLLLYSSIAINVFYYATKSINQAELLKAPQHMVQKIRKFVTSRYDQAQTFILFFERDYSPLALIGKADNKESMLACVDVIADDESSYDSTVYYEVSFYEYYFCEAYDEEMWGDEESDECLLLYDLRYFYVISQTNACVYYRIRVTYDYWRYKIWTKGHMNAWLYCSWAIHYVEWRLKFAYGGLFYSLISGIAFVFCQRYEYSHANYDITDGVYGSIFYSLTGLHGLHVILGLVFIFYIYGRYFWTLRRDFQHSLYPHYGVTAAVWYWHFVDIVWFCVYFIVYIWGGTTYFEGW